MPQIFYGHVTLSGGSPAAAGVSIVAKVGGTQFGSTTTDSNGQYGVNPIFVVSPTASDVTIDFYINGTKADQSVPYSPGNRTEVNLTIGAVPAGSCGITTTSLPAGTAGAAYSASLAASGGTTPYTWSLSTGALPSGLTLNSTSGLISGTPTTAQTYSFTVQANDSAAHSCTRALSIQINTTMVSIQSSILGASDTFSLSNGVLSVARDLASSDGRVKLSLPVGSSINMQGSTQLGAASESNPPASSDNSTLIRAYSFVPSGATFSPPATLTLKYETASLPSGAAESGLYIAFWNGTAWQSLSSSVNTTTKEVSAQVAHFTIFAIRYMPLQTTQTQTQTQTQTTTLSANVLGTTSSFSTSGGTLPAATSVSSANGKIGINLAANTAIGLPSGSQQIVVIQLASSPTPPTDSKVIEAYAFGPDNTTFNPAASVTVKYDATALPADVQETGLYLALLQNSTWTEVPSTVNTQAKTVTAQVSHFSVYALLGRVTAATTPASHTPATTTPASSAFSFSDMAVSPESAKAGAPVTVSVRIVNGGTAGATGTVVLKINDQVETQKDVKLDPGKSQMVSFTVVKSDPGKYTVSVNGQSAAFSITAAAGGEAPAGMSMPILIVIILGGLLVVVLAIVLIKRQRSSGY